MSLEKHPNLKPWPPTLLCEDDTAMTDYSDSRQRSDSCRGNEVQVETKGTILTVN